MVVSAVVKVIWVNCFASSAKSTHRPFLCIVASMTGGVIALFVVYTHSNAGVVMH